MYIPCIQRLELQPFYLKLKHFSHAQRNLNNTSQQPLVSQEFVRTSSLSTSPSELIGDRNRICTQETFRAALFLFPSLRIRSANLWLWSTLYVTVTLKSRAILQLNVIVNQSRPLT